MCRNDRSPPDASSAAPVSGMHLHKSCALRSEPLFIEDHDHDFSSRTFEDILHPPAAERVTIVYIRDLLHDRDPGRRHMAENGLCLAKRQRKWALATT